MTDRSVIVNGSPERWRLGLWRVWRPSLRAKRSNPRRGYGSDGLLRRFAPRNDESPAMKFQPPTGSSITSQSNRLDAGCGDDVAPFRHFVVDALSHAVGSIGDDFEAIVAQLLGDDRRLQNFDRPGR